MWVRNRALSPSIKVTKLTMVKHWLRLELFFLAVAWLEHSGSAQESIKSSAVFLTVICFFSLKEALEKSVTEYLSLIQSSTFSPFSFTCNWNCSTSGQNWFDNDFGIFEVQFLKIPHFKVEVVAWWGGHLAERGPVEKGVSLPCTPAASWLSDFVPV